MPGIMVVTGGSRGLGAAIARLGAERGFDVCITYRHEAEQARKVAKSIEDRGRRALAVKADAGNESDVVRTFEEVDRRLGRVTVLVNNAGTSGRKGRVESLDSPEIMEMLTTNVCGPFLCSREAIRRMSPRHGGNGGVIINLSSVAARLGGPGRNVHYAASKGAINSMTIGLARELGSEGIRVNAVIPGLIDTESQDRARMADVAPTVPLRRAGHPIEVAHTVLWLASEEASYVSGALVDISGGR